MSTLEEQAENLAMFLAGMLAGMSARQLPELFVGPVAVEPIRDQAAFCITTESGTVIECRLRPLAVGR